jgi:carotenoid cleavage dioxygenase
MRDQRTGAVDFWDPGSNHHAGEVFFVPDGDGEGEGWLMTFVYDHARNVSDFVILDAMDVARGPVAEIRMPRRVPYGFHGAWIPA